MGRVAATGHLIDFGTMPIAALVAGALAAQVGTRATIIVMTAAKRTRVPVHPGDADRPDARPPAQPGVITTLSACSSAALAKTS